MAPGLRGVVGGNVLEAAAVAWQLRSAPCGTAALRLLPPAPPWRGFPLAREAGGPRGSSAAHWRRAARGDGVSAPRRETPHAPCGPAMSRLPQQGLVLAARVWRGAAGQTFPPPPTPRHRPRLRYRHPALAAYSPAFASRVAGKRLSPAAQCSPGQGWILGKSRQ